MNYSKLILVGCISAFVAFTTSVVGVAGTIIGSVISSVLYNMLSEALEKPVTEATFSSNFEWEIAYVFPLVVIAIIQLLLILALLSEWGLLPHTFLNVFLSLQDFANNNLYRVLGLALIVMSAYPMILKPEIVKKSHGVIIAIVGLIFLARGFVDTGNRLTDLYNPIFAHFDFPIAVIAFILLVFVIYKILINAKESESEFKVFKHNLKEKNDDSTVVKRVTPSNSNEHYIHKNHDKVNHYEVHNPKHVVKNRSNSHNANHNHVKFKKQVVEHETGINKSSSKIQFESNDLLDDYKK